MKAITEKELIGLVHHSMYQQWERRGYAAPVDTLIECGVLPKKAYEEWRFGKVPYLEKVCIVNLHKLSFIMHQMRVFAKKNQWTPSFCYYKQWGIKKKDGQGHKPVIPLRFSKSGEAEIERWYATHFVDKKHVKQYQMDLLAYFDNVYPEIGKEIEETKVLSDELGEKILQVADEFKDRAATK
mgnify:CR=1 FL=1